MGSHRFGADVASRSVIGNATYAAQYAAFLPEGHGGVEPSGFKEGQRQAGGRRGKNLFSWKTDNFLLSS